LDKVDEIVGPSVKVNSLIDGHSSFNVGIYGSGLGIGVRCQPVTAVGYV